MRRRRGSQDGKGEITAPPAEQLAAFAIESVHERTASGGLNLMGVAYRRRPMIDILRDLFTEPQYKALRHYRHHADIADRSPFRDSLCLQRGGSGSPTITTLNAVRVVTDCESAAGQLAGILRAVVVNDMSLSQYAIQLAGAVEQRRERRGRVFCQLEPRRKALERARLEIRMAAVRVEAELAA